MTVSFFEGPAGSGKTYKLIERTRELVTAGMLAEEQRVLALTFMHGARRRLEASLGEHPELRRRFECKTVDAFAQTIATRQRGLADARALVAPENLNQFDAICYVAGRLLESPCVPKWIAASYPLILIDEAQDLDPGRLRILQGLAPHCALVAAADEFQCLENGVDAGPTISWLDSFGNTIRLDGSHRTSQSGILQAAQTVRDAGSVPAVLTKHANYETWQGPGFKLVEVPGSPALLARTISWELEAFKSGDVAIITPDTRNPLLMEALAQVQTRHWSYRKGGAATFGPFSLGWDRSESERAKELWQQLALPEICTLEHVSERDGAAAVDPMLVRVRARMERSIRLSGERSFASERVNEMIEDAVRDVSRFGGHSGPRRVTMSVHRAKNREFANVIVLWPPYQVGGNDDHQRRLLYNAITRAKLRCTVIAVGKGRVATAPFASESATAPIAVVKSTRRKKPRSNGRHARSLRS